MFAEYQIPTQEKLIMLSDQSILKGFVYAALEALRDVENRSYEIEKVHGYADARYQSLAAVISDDQPAAVNVIAWIFEEASEMPLEQNQEFDIDKISALRARLGCHTNRCLTSSKAVAVKNLTNLLTMMTMPGRQPFQMVAPMVAKALKISATARCYEKCLIPKARTLHCLVLIEPMHRHELSMRRAVEQ